MAADDADIDHTIAWAQGGPTHASNLKCLCRFHHLLKTFWDWGDQQLPDGTLIWTTPSGQTHVTTPGSALLFPALAIPTSTLAPPAAPATEERCTDRTAMMPLRTSTRAENRARYIAAERHLNHQIRIGYHRTPNHNPSRNPTTDEEPPPF